MKIVYVPLFRAAVSYAVSSGRRWSLLEQMLLIELATERRTVSKLAIMCRLPEGLVVEALINLLRVGWIEVRSTADGTIFTATPVGKRNAAQEDLRPTLRREVKWISLCMDRLTGSWLRLDDLDLVYDSDLPSDAEKIAPTRSTLSYDDPGVRDLLHLSATEGFEGFQPAARAPARLHGRVTISHGDVARGLPDYASLALREAVLSAARELPDVAQEPSTQAMAQRIMSTSTDIITPDDIIVGGPAHLDLIRDSLHKARFNVIIHSCFLSPRTVQKLLPDLEKAGRRGVRVDLLWGLHSDFETESPPEPIVATQRVLDGLSSAARTRVQLSTRSSGSHCKILIHDDSASGGWITAVGSCNFLSSDYDEIEVSVRMRSPKLASQVTSHLISAQLPASGEWPSLVHRLNSVWNSMRRAADMWVEQGSHFLHLMADEDHYGCVTLARDRARRDIVLGCDLFGLAAETSVLVPLERAAALGKHPKVYYCRASRGMASEGRSPNAREILDRGIETLQADKLHGKFLAWDDDALAVTSFNWLATVADARARGAELGVLIMGPGLRNMLATKMMAESEGLIDFLSPAQASL
jgi:phosphatidylserine/phosphatidylglycerophosphate/cardiolipin synthase-like enzyme